MGRARAALANFWRKGYEDNVTGLSAMVAYNLLLSILPITLIALFIAGRVLRSDELEESVLLDLERIFPSAAESTLIELVRRLQEASTTTGIIALVAAVYFASSFWGALDTAFCRIYHRPCRSWVRQKLFAFGMFAVVLLFIAASVAVPAVQSLIATSADDLPFGLSDVRGLVYWVTLATGVVLLFALLCLIYQLVPRGFIPWRCVWPGVLGATVAISIVDYGFPLYLQNVSTLRAGTTLVFVLIALVWFYALAIILLGRRGRPSCAPRGRRARAAIVQGPVPTTIRPGQEPSCCASSRAAAHESRRRMRAYVRRSAWSRPKPATRSPRQGQARASTAAARATRSLDGPYG